MKKVKVRLDMPELFKSEIICLVGAINRNEEKQILYWKKCVSKNINTALDLEIITANEAEELRGYYQLE